jgi:hypothetical protein
VTEEAAVRVDMPARNASPRRSHARGVVATLLAIVVAGAMTGAWSRAVANSLVCAAQNERADAVVIDNFDPNYLLFERTQTIVAAQPAARVYVPSPASEDGEFTPVELGFVDVMVRIARLPPPTLVPVRHAEPFTLTAVRQIGRVLRQQHMKSIALVTPAFRSKRSFLVYSAVLAPQGISVSCVPVFGLHDASNWTHSWHGMQDVAEQIIKREYYRLWVLPRYSSRGSYGLSPNEQTGQHAA